MSPPFQYSQRAHMFVSLDGQMRAAVEEQRDRELEDFLAWLETISGGLVVMGTIATPGPPTSGQVPTKAKGDIWIDSNGNGWSWTGTTWVNIGPVKGPAGAVGPIGAPGPVGATGATGPQGATGPAGGFTGSAGGRTIIDGGTATSPGDTLIDCGAAT